VVNVFAREVTDELASLVKQLDTVVASNKGAAGFVVLFSQDPDADEAKLKALAKKHGIKNLPLTIYDGATGPPNYKISKDADVTVHAWGPRTKVTANRAFAKGGLNKESIAATAAAVDKALK
jgi:hypothetical protein